MPVAEVAKVQDAQPLPVFSAKDREVFKALYDEVKAERSKQKKLQAALAQQQAMQEQRAKELAQKELEKESPMPSSLISSSSLEQKTVTTQKSNGRTTDTIPWTEDWFDQMVQFRKEHCSST